MQMKKKRRVLPVILVALSFIVASLFIGVIVWYWWYTNILFRDRVFTPVYINNIYFGGKTKDEIEAYWQEKNKLFGHTNITLVFDDRIATLSGADLKMGFDATLSATQSFMVGRSPYYISNFSDRFLKARINLTPVLQWDKEYVHTIIQSLNQQITIPAEDALFKFSGGKVITFKPSKNGRKVDENKLEAEVEQAIMDFSQGQVHGRTIEIPIQIVTPKSSTTDVNDFGIKERIGFGYSEFSGSIPGRVHNVALAASKLHGILIKPGEVFSFNNTIGDISAATGYQSAYIIKDGRTVMGDGGGVCQVSTTLFRAALNAGLPIIERHEHSYRVHYYEDGGFKAGLDATVFDPTDDLKIKNDTSSYILIQTLIDTTNMKLTFELFGTSDGRKAEILNHQVWGSSPPPPALYQDDPTLPKGIVKQVDFAAWGAKASFQYKVIRDGSTLIDQTFNSTYRPWQAVFLRGTKE